MHYEVTLNMLDDNGQVLWGFSKSEVVVRGDDPEANLLEMADRILTIAEEGRASIAAQAVRDGVILSSRDAPD